MRSLKAMFLVLGVAFGFQAAALTEAQVRDAYAGCVKFLGMSPREQREVARRSGHSLSDALWACRDMVRRGVERCVRDEREYQRCLRGGCSTPSRPRQEEGRRCVSSVQCRGSLENCLNGYCREVNGANHCGAGGLSCTPGETCRNERCGH